MKRRKSACAPAVETQSGLVEQDDDAVRVVLERGECGKEAEEPLEAGGAGLEVVGEPVPAVLDADVEVAGDSGLAVGVMDRALVQVDLHGQVRVLFPVLEDLLCEVVADRFEFGLALFEVLRRQGPGRRADELQQGSGGLDRGSTGLFLLAGQVGQGDPAGEVLVVAEVEELRFPLAQDTCSLLPSALVLAQSPACRRDEDVDVRCGVAGVLSRFQAASLLQGAGDTPRPEDAAQRGRYFLVGGPSASATAFRSSSPSSNAQVIGRASAITPERVSRTLRHRG
ncbi:hypothetical protein [Streptomyces sp. NPDC058665]|uniref:hypothetical protein n=1 Tax=Streptomyces sp. NPDC058665 TaxID=3346586 RepID=UPI0036505356